MLKVNRNRCLGCGLCARICPQGAISLIWGKAEIDARRCNSCYHCADVCRQGAIGEVIVVSPEELRVSVSSLERQTDEAIRRIDSLLSRA